MIMYLKTEPLLKSSVTPTTFVWVGSAEPFRYIYCQNWEFTYKTIKFEDRLSEILAEN